MSEFKKLSNKRFSANYNEKRIEVSFININYTDK